ncbi:hypothetical protein ABK040_009509 [Willaertia magna]
MSEQQQTVNKQQGTRRRQNNQVGNQQGNQQQGNRRGRGGFRGGRGRGNNRGGRGGFRQGGYRRKPQQEQENQQQENKTQQNQQTTTTTQQTSTEPKLRVPKFVKIKDVEPGATFFLGSGGFNLVLKVVTVDIVSETQGNVIAEALVGDETGCIILTARNEEVKLLKPNASIIVRNAKIGLFKKNLRLKIDMWGKLQSFEEGKKLISVNLSDNFTVNTNKNLSNDEYEPGDNRKQK